MNDNSQKQTISQNSLARVGIQDPAPVENIPNDRNPALVYLARLAPGSRRTMAHALVTIAGLFGEEPDTLNWSRLRYQHTQAIRAMLAERYSPGGVNKMLAALRGVLKEGWRLGQIDAETFQRASDLRNVRAEKLPTGRALSKRELQRLFRVCRSDESPIGARDTALIGLLYGCGLRRNELVHLDLADYNPATGELHVRAGKGSKERIAYVIGGAAEALGEWLNCRGTAPGPLFWPSDGRGRSLVNRRMSDQAVRLMLLRRAKQARISHSFTPHDLRRSFISDLLSAGADMSVVQKMAGHANIQTTAMYDRRGEESKRSAAELLHIPK